MTLFRELPDDLYHQVMETEEEIPKGDILPNRSAVWRAAELPAGPKHDASHH